MIIIIQFFSAFKSRPTFVLRCCTPPRRSRRSWGRRRRGGEKRRRGKKSGRVPGSRDPAPNCSAAPRSEVTVVRRAAARGAGAARRAANEPDDVKSRTGSPSHLHPHSLLPLSPAPPQQRSWVQYGSSGGLDRCPWVCDVGRRPGNQERGVEGDSLWELEDYLAVLLE